MSQLISFGCWFRFHFLSTIILMHYTTLDHNSRLLNIYRGSTTVQMSIFLGEFVSHQEFPQLSYPPGIHQPPSSSPGDASMPFRWSGRPWTTRGLIGKWHCWNDGAAAAATCFAGSLRFCQTFSESKGVENAWMTFGGWSSVKESEDWYTKAKDSILRSWVKVSACFNNLLIYGILILMSL